MYNKLYDYFLSLFFIIYLWRLDFIGPFLNVLLVIVLVGGINKNWHYFLEPRKLGGKAFYFIILGMAVSFLYAAYNRGSIAEQYELNSVYTSLRLWRVLEGILLFLVIVLNIDSKEKLLKILKITFVVSFFFTILVIFRISDEFIKLLGIKVYDITENKETIFYNVSYKSFATMEEGAFGSIVTFFMVFTLIRSKLERDHKTLFYLIVIIFLVAGLQTLSRTVAIKIIVSLFVYIIFNYKLNFKFVSQVIFIMFFIVFIFSYSNFGEYIVQRFEEIVLNLQDLILTKHLYARDSLQYRLVRSLLGVPLTLSGWIFGSGGIQTAMYGMGKSIDHIEYTNWLWQYGLITFIPFILFYGTQLFSSFRIVYNSSDVVVKSYVSLGGITALMIVLSMITSPQFYYSWLFIAFTVTIRNIFEPESHNENKSKLNRT